MRIQHMQDKESVINSDTTGTHHVPSLLVKGVEKRGAVANTMSVDIQLNTFLGSQIHIQNKSPTFLSGKSELYRETLAQRGWNSVALTVKGDKCGLATTRRRLFSSPYVKSPHGGNYAT